eukprot:gnl/TRDRNA2_/TRDRNA2_177341_c0_seq5.p1 gnl/TRDRNA2_/TRDRNA2_177341_c0~~gnl/TRDRNA2_/TRDRNA2_177341_c0_seq5.p1  ORF type:complete len:551 (+),score=63.62 gnl/TRDRNA2_/TRDRNA2_177341_c0_seq5:87-1739(+)
MEAAGWSDKEFRRPSSDWSAVNDGPQCCVCFQPTKAFTRCLHPLCDECHAKLPRQVCPLCRRALVSSFHSQPSSVSEAFLPSVITPRVERIEGHALHSVFDQMMQQPSSQPSLASSSRRQVPSSVSWVPSTPPRQAQSNGRPTHTASTVARMSATDLMVLAESEELPPSGPALEALACALLKRTHHLTDAADSLPSILQVHSAEQLLGTKGLLIPVSHRRELHSLSLLRRAIAEKIKSLASQKAAAARSLDDALALVEQLRSAADSVFRRSAAFIAVRASLSNAVAKHLSALPIGTGLLPVAARLTEFLRDLSLEREQVVKAVAVMVRRAGEEKNPPGALSCTVWTEVEATIRHLIALREHGPFEQTVEPCAPRVARQVAEAVCAEPLEQLHTVLRAAVALLSRWPTALRQADIAVPPLLLRRLEPLATRWSQKATTASPRLKLPQTEWWLETLQVATVCGWLDPEGISTLCKALARGLANEGVYTATTTGWPAGKGEQVVARQLQAQLLENSEGIRYVPHHKLLLFDCPNAGRFRSFLVSHIVNNDDPD